MQIDDSGQTPKNIFPYFMFIVIGLSLLSKLLHKKKQLRWLNTVLRAVSGNLRDGACFKLHKQTWRRKSNGTQKTIPQNLRIKIL